MLSSATTTAPTLPRSRQALINGLLAGGAEVHDIGFALSPMAYFAQFELGVEGVAMVTASHNDNGWTGIKMGIERPLTFAPDDMTALKEPRARTAASPREAAAATSSCPICRSAIWRTS